MVGKLKLLVEWVGSLRGINKNLVEWVRRPVGMVKTLGGVGEKTCWVG